MELYEKKTNLSAPLAASLELPGLIGWNSAEAFQAVVAFCEKNKDLLSQINENLSSFFITKDTITEQRQTENNNAFAAMTEQWTEAT